MQRYFLFVCVHLSAVPAFVPAAAAQPHKDAFGDPLPAGAIARIGTVRYREGDFYSLRHSPVLSPDGKRLLLSLWDLKFAELPEWKEHKLLADEKQDDSERGGFRCFAFTPDSKTFVCYDSPRKRISFIDIATGKRTKTCSLPSAPSLGYPGLTISRDGQTLVLLGYDEKSETMCSLLVWDLTAGKLKRSIRIGMQDPDNTRPTFAVSPDGSQLARGTHQVRGVATPRHFLEFWNLKTGEAIRKLALDGAPQQMEYAPDGTWLAVTVARAFHANSQPVLRIYDTATGKELHNLRMRRSLPYPAGHMQALAVAPDGQAVYLSEDNFTKIGQWDPRTGERVHAFAVPVRVEAIRQIVCTPQGKVFALGWRAAAAHFWEVKTGTVYSPRNVPGAEITEVAFAPHGELFVSSADDVFAWWDPRTGKKKRDQHLQWPRRSEVEEHLPPHIREGFRGLRLAPHGALLVGLGRPSPGFYDVKTGQLLYNETAGIGLQFFDRGAKAASLNAGTVRYWNSRTGRDVAKFDVPLDQDRESPNNLAVSQSGKHFAVAIAAGYYEGRVVLWNAERKMIARQWTWKSEMISFSPLLVFSPDERWLFVRTHYGPPYFARVGPDPQGDHVLHARGILETVAFSPDSRQFAYRLARPTGKEDRSIFIVEMASKKVRRTLAGHSRSDIGHLAYAPDGGLLASGGSYDATVLIWEAGLAAFRRTGAEEAPSQGRLKEWFAQMGDADAARAFQGMIQLVRAPQQTVPLLGHALPPAPRPELHGRAIAAWIDDIRHERFAVRSKASMVLLNLAEAAEAPLREALPRAPDVETKRRLERLLERIAGRELTPQEILHVRAVEVLEAIATPDARAVLARWAAGFPSAVLTEHARMALKRMH